MSVPGAYEPELEFSDPSAVRETALFSFNPLVYLYFMLSFLIVPYPLYWCIARRLNWETNEKSMARHWSDMFHGFSYGTLLFVFGNYTHAYRYVVVVMTWYTILTFLQLDHSGCLLPDVIWLWMDCRVTIYKDIITQH